jgi:hypothetical protein
VTPHSSEREVRERQGDPVSVCGMESDADRIASVVMEVVFEHYPAQLSIEEVIRNVAADPASLGNRTDVSDAICDLIRAGLLHRSGDFAFATRAAVRAAELGL